MSTVARTTDQVDLAYQQAGRTANQYGQFSPDGREYWITNPATPRPWVNVISNPRMGLVVSQTGSGFSWLDNSQLAVLNRWQQEFTHDSSGRFLYIRDVDSNQLWSLAPAPTWPAYDKYVCRHGIGFTTFETEFVGIAATWTLFCHPIETVELWRVELHNQTDQPRRLELCAYLEWNCGVAPAPRREFQKLFLENEYDPSRHAIFARSHMWDVPSREHGHWNTDFPFVSALSSTEPVLSAQGDKTAFFGRYGDPRSPAALQLSRWQPEFGRHGDAVAALRNAIELRPKQRRICGYALAVDESQAGVQQLIEKATSVEWIDQTLVDARADWQTRLSAQRVDTPEPALNYLVNDWLCYQAISGRLWARSGYYQQSGAPGYRDQLQDSQIWLPSAPENCRAQINLHAAHQFTDGSVYHWWHPLTEEGLRTEMTDDLLWLAFVTASYLKETGNFDILQDATPFVDDARPRPLSEHVNRAFQRVFKRSSPRGLPYIGAGDWNDGLNAAGLQERGESIWLGHFVTGLLVDWAEIYSRTGDDAFAAELRARHTALVATLNEHGWDGQWYIRATLDDGRRLGSRQERVGKIFLNAQTWAVLNDVAPAERAAACMAAVREHLVSDAGALLLAPAFDQPDRKVGYITRYAPGLRENGGVYTHAATWAIAAACKMHDAPLVARLLKAINPALKDPEQYYAEPYVTPGNVDGPDSPHHCRAGWTWYTGSAAWLQRVVTHWVLGVRPEWSGLLLDPCLPPKWETASLRRPYRGCIYTIEIRRDSSQAGDAGVQVEVDGERLPTNVIPVPAQFGREYQVVVYCR